MITFRWNCNSCLPSLQWVGNQVRSHLLRARQNAHAQAESWRVLHCRKRSSTCGGVFEYSRNHSSSQSKFHSQIVLFKIFIQRDWTGATLYQKTMEKKTSVWIGEKIVLYLKEKSRFVLEHQGVFQTNNKQIKPICT